MPPFSLPKGLTPRQREIVLLLARGLTSKEISARLHISALTVRTHRENIMRRLGVRSTAELVASVYSVDKALSAIRQMGN